MRLTAKRINNKPALGGIPAAEDGGESKFVNGPRNLSGTCSAIFLMTISAAA
jgi:hypothetical protein